jgi:hypothetical protein
MNLFRIFVIILFLFGYANSEEYIVPNFLGGINVATDSTDLAPNQALELVNLTFDMPNVLTSREGYTCWDSVAFNTADEIEQILIYKPYCDQSCATKRMTVATNGKIHIYLNPGTVNWDDYALQFDGDSLQVSSGNPAEDFYGEDWLYAKLGYLDSMDISGTRYSVNYNLNSDTLITVTGYSGSTDTIGEYTVIYGTQGGVYMTQEGGFLYVCDSNDVAIVWNDTDYVSIALLDSGLVSDTAQLTGGFEYGIGKARVRQGRNYVTADSANVDWGQTNVDSGYYFTYRYRTFNKPRKAKSGFHSPTFSGLKEWTAVITGWKDTTGSRHQLYLDRTFGTRSQIGSVWGYHEYEIHAPIENCVFDSGFAVYDSNKNWMDFTYGQNYLQNYYVIDGKRGYAKTGPESFISDISCNEEEQFSIAWGDTFTFEADDNYYIFSRVPFRDIETYDSLYKAHPYYEQVFFYNNQMFAFGYDNVGFGAGKQINRNRVWYSDFGESKDFGIFHRYIKPSYSFDVDVNEDVTTMFSLRGAAYIGTDKSIWRFTGTPGLDYSGSDMILYKVVSNMGIANMDSWVKTSEENGYFVHRTGVYRFDGIRPVKISWFVDPIIENNYASRKVMVYQNQLLYVSFTDSNFTQVFDERYPISIGNGKVALPSYRLDFGMTCAYAPPDTNIIYFGHSEFKGRVYYYPNGIYRDIIAQDDTNNIEIAYKSGWQTFAGYDVNKRLHEGYGTASTDTSIRFVYRKQFDNDATGEYFQVAVNDTIDSQMIIGGYKLLWKEIPPWRK